MRFALGTALAGFATFHVAHASLPAQAIMMNPAFSDTAIVAAAIDHIANTSPGRVMYLDYRTANTDPQAIEAIELFTISRRQGS